MANSLILLKFLLRIIYFSFLFFCHLVDIQTDYPVENETAIYTVTPNTENDKTTTSSSSSLIRPLKSSLEKIHHNLNDDDDNNDSSTSAVYYSIHLPVKKQRAISEIIRKRNSRHKVEDYKRSFQKFNDYRSLTMSKSDYDLSTNQSSMSNTCVKRLNKAKSVDISIEYDKQTQVKTLSNNKQDISNEYVKIRLYSYI